MLMILLIFLFAEIQYFYQTVTCNFQPPFYKPVIDPNLRFIRKVHTFYKTPTLRIISSKYSLSLWQHMVTKTFSLGSSCMNNFLEARNKAFSWRTMTKKLFNSTMQVSDEKGHSPQHHHWKPKNQAFLSVQQSIFT